MKGDAKLIGARCSLARALTEVNRPEDASAEYRSALAVDPDSTSCLINFAWLLSSHRDATVRRPDEAIQLAERAVALTNRGSAAALDALAAANASASRFDEAVQIGLEALRLLERERAGGSAEDVRARIDLYKRHVAFIVPDP